MIITKYGKSYDTSDGTEQRDAGSLPRGARVPGSAQQQRWEDDGGPVVVDHEAISAHLLSHKPAWSVLSLLELNQAIQREHQNNYPVRLLHESEQRNIRQVDAAQTNAKMVARAIAQRYRNAWEHT
jgi:hypothetical protein